MQISRQAQAPMKLIKRQIINKVKTKTKIKIKTKAKILIKDQPFWILTANRTTITMANKV